MQFRTFCALCITALLMLSGCEKDNQKKNSGPQQQVCLLQVRFSPHAADLPTPVFKENDSILVRLADASLRYFYIDPATAGKVTSTFRGLLEDGESLGDFVFFPGPGFNNAASGLHFTYPSGYQYGEQMVPYAAAIPEAGESLVMRPLGACLSIHYDTLSEEAASLSVRLEGADALSPLPVLEDGIFAAAGSASQWEVRLQEPPTDGRFLIPVPAGTYTSARICLNTATGAAVDFSETGIEGPFTLTPGEVRTVEVTTQRTLSASLPALVAAGGTVTRELLWKEGDCLEIVSADGIAEKELRSGAGSAVASFGTVTDPSAYGLAFCPVGSIQPASASEGPTVSYPEEYPYYDSTAVVTPLFAAPDWTAEVSYAFRHLGGVIRFRYRNVPADVHGFTAAFKRKVTGRFSFDPAAETPQAVSEEGTSSVHLHFAQPSSIMNFYVPVPCGTYDSVTVVLTREDKSAIAGTSHEFTKSDCVITPGTYYVMPNLTLMSIGADLP